MKRGLAVFIGSWLISQCWGQGWGVGVRSPWALLPITGIVQDASMRKTLRLSETDPQSAWTTAQALFKKDHSRLECGVVFVLVARQAGKSILAAELIVDEITAELNSETSKNLLPDKRVINRNLLISYNMALAMVRQTHGAAFNGTGDKRARYWGQRLRQELLDGGQLTPTQTFVLGCSELVFGEVPECRQLCRSHVRRHEKSGIVHLLLSMACGQGTVSKMTAAGKPLPTLPDERSDPAQQYAAAMLALKYMPDNPDAHYYAAYGCLEKRPAEAKMHLQRYLAQTASRGKVPGRVWAAEWVRTH